MKKIIYFLLIIILLAGIAGGGFMLYKHFKNQPEPVTESNILTESQDLLKNHASITFGEGANAWTISTADKLAPIYIDDLRAPGKGVTLNYSSMTDSPTIDEIPVTVDYDSEDYMLMSFNAYASISSGRVDFNLYYDDSAKNYRLVIQGGTVKELYQNVFYAIKGSDEYGYTQLENDIKSTCKPGDNYLLGIYHMSFVFCEKNFKEYYELNGRIDIDPSAYSGVVLQIPVYYRVK